MYKPYESKQFRKSFKKIKKHKNFKFEIFEYVVRELSSGRKLEAKFKDHELSGKYLGYRDCHIQNDIVLVYKYEEDVLWLVLADIGSHSELF